MMYGVEVTRLDTVDHGVELPSLYPRGACVAGYVAVENSLGATYHGVELGATDHSVELDTVDHGVDPLLPKRPSPLCSQITRLPSPCRRAPPPSLLAPPCPAHHPAPHRRPAPRTAPPRPSPAVTFQKFTFKNHSH